MLDLNVLAELTDEADMFVAFARSARCCDALEPCHECAVLRRDIAARRRVIIVPVGHAATRTNAPCMVDGIADGVTDGAADEPVHLHLVEPVGEEVSLAG